jgi:hypothetical protein
MPNRIRQISYASSEEDDGSIYSQDELDHSDQSTIIDTENPPAATSDEHLGVSETTPEKAQSLHDDDDSSIEDDLPTMLTNLKDKIAKELVYATIIARSKESQQIETSNDAKSSDLETKLAEIERSRDYQIGRKELYKVRVAELSNGNLRIVSSSIQPVQHIALPYILLRHLGCHCYKHELRLSSHL